MAIQTGPFPFTGKMGNVIGYRRGKKYCFRSAPDKVQQTAATRRSALLFGKASRLGAAMRQALHGQLDAPADPGMGNALTTALLSVLYADDLHRVKRFMPAHFKHLRGHRLHPHAGLHDALTVAPAVHRDGQGRICVTLPAMQYYATHPQATHLNIRAVALHVQPGFCAATATAAENVLVKVGVPSAEQELIIPAGAGALSCVVLEVTCWQEERGRLYPLLDKRYLAAGIVAVLRSRETGKRHIHSGRQRQERLPVVTGPDVFFQQRE